MGKSYTKGSRKKDLSGTGWIIILFISVFLAGCGGRHQTAEPYLPVEQTHVSPGTQRVVTAHRLNLRQGPTTRARIKAVLKKGDLLTVQSTQGRWLRVLTGSGREGWVYGRYVGDVDQRAHLTETVGGKTEKGEGAPGH